MITSLFARLPQCSWRGLSLAAAVLLLGQVSSVSGQSPYAPEVGSQHVDFRLPRISDRKPVSLSDYRGKKVLLIQFASW